MEKTPPDHHATLLAPGEAFDLARIAQFLPKLGHGGFLGMTATGQGEDWVELSLPWREDLVGVEETGVLASGPIISLLDTATSLAVWMKRGAFLPQVTLDLRIDYMRAARKGMTVIARGECYRLTRSMAFVRGIAHDGDIADPVAQATGIFMLTGGQ